MAAMKCQALARGFQMDGLVMLAGEAMDTERREAA
jgi:hypothetical protein